MNAAADAAQFTRTVIVGNSGSGKSWLAAQLTERLRISTIDLDQIHWDDASFAGKRDADVARQMVVDAAAQPHWIIEGVFGWLVSCAMPQATALVWLDLSWPECRAALFERGPRHGEKAFVELLVWAEAYWTRETSSSFAGHTRLFESFPAAKRRLRSRQEVLGFLAGLSA